MTPEEISRLRSKQWLLRAKAARQTVSKVIAEAIGKPPSAIAFADREETDRISAIFSRNLDANEEIEFPNREKAIEFVMRELSGITGTAFLLEDDFDNCGAIILDFSEALASIDTLLQCQHECFRLVSSDGNAGVCVFQQEGSAPHYPRYVTLWRPDKSTQAGAATTPA